MASRAGKGVLTVRKKIYISLGGYISDSRKTAVCHTVNNTFSIVELPSERVVYTGELSPPINDPDSGDQIKIADFTKLSDAGTYCLKCGYRRSEPFVISDKPYTHLKDMLMRGIHLNRCGYDLSQSAVPDECREFVHGKCHTEFTPMYYGGQQLDVSGGWHEGGSYGKSVTVAASACASLMYSYILYPKSFEAEKDGLSDILDECRWGLEWLMKMQGADGRVYHKIDGAEAFLNPQSPMEDTTEYYIFPESADAAMMFTAVTALGARVFADIDRHFSRLLSRAASNSWLWIVNTPTYEPWKLPTGASPDGVGDLSYQSRNDCYMWMLSEMYALTGDESFSKRFEEMLFFNDTTGFSLDSTGGFAALSYLTVSENRNPGVVFYLKKKFGDRADKIIIASSSGYGSSLNSTALGDRYNSMSNMEILSDCIICQTAYMIFGLERYRSAAAVLMQYILGKNPSGISYITGMGELSPLRPAHSLSVSTMSKALPGMVVCGANKERGDDFSKWRLSVKTPPARCYLDNECSYSTNSTSVAFGAAALLALSFFDRSGLSADNITLKG